MPRWGPVYLALNADGLGLAYPPGYPLQVQYLDTEGRAIGEVFFGREATSAAIAGIMVPPDIIAAAKRLTPGSFEEFKADGSPWFPPGGGDEP